MTRDTRKFIRDGLYLVVRSEQFKPVFRQIKREIPFLERFSSAEDFISFVQETPFALEKNQLVYRLIKAYQSGLKLTAPRYKKALLNLLLLSLWQQLEQTHYVSKRRLWFLDDPFSEVYGAYLNEISEWVPIDEFNIIAALQDKAESFIKQTVREENRFRKLHIRAYKPKQISVDYTRVEEMSSEWVAQSVITEEERKIVLGHAVYAKTFKELAKELICSPAACSKKYYRTIKQLREFLKDKVNYDSRGRAYFPEYF
jgi:hypothetical protein